MFLKLLAIACCLIAAHVSTVASQCTSTGSKCISAASTACRGLPDGDYQACEGCTVYHSCSGGVNWSNRPCPLTNQGGLRGKLVWAATGTNSGYCDYYSSTCRECVSSGGCNSGSKSGTKCITRAVNSCIGLPDGDYQACEGCTYYHTCSNGLISAERPCARRSDGTQLVWVTERAARGHCDWVSSTCNACP